MSEDSGKDNKQMIKVFLVDDSPMALTLLKRILSQTKDIVVVGTAANGKEALELVPRAAPDVICTDLHMPVMDGLEFTRAVMERFPKPVLVVSVSVQEGSMNVFNLLEAGAIDIFLKPRGGAEVDFMASAERLQRKIRIVAGVHLIRRIKKAAPPLEVLRIPEKSHLKHKAVVIGASTGGPQALHEILSRLPPDFPMPVICVQHIESGFLGSFMDWLRLSSKMKISMAVEGETPRQGSIYFPQEDRHLTIDNQGRFRCLDDSALTGHCPSIDVMFKSAAKYFGGDVLGVLLSGMGADGAEGMKAISDAGGVTIVQNEKTCVIFSMPQRAIELGAADFVLPLNEIPSAIINQTSANQIPE